MKTDRLIGFGLVLSLLGCDHSNIKASKSGAQEIESLIQKSNSGLSLHELKVILVVSEHGCAACNRAFAGFASKHIEDSTALLWVSAMGTRVDISPFRSNDGRVIWDYADRLKTSGILQGSGVIILRDGAVDSILTIDAKSLESTIQYVSAVLDQVQSNPHETGSDSILSP